MQRQLQQVLLVTLLKAGDEAQTETVLKVALRSAFATVALPQAELLAAIRACEESGWIAGTKDELLGNVWALTPTGKIKAQSIA